MEIKKRFSSIPLHRQGGGITSRIKKFTGGGKAAWELKILRDTKNMSFDKAFATARREGYDQFEWNGNFYGTLYADEVSAPTKVHMNNKNEVVVTAPRTKITRKTSGFLPVDESNLVNRDGNTRVYKNYEGRYYVVDDYDNIVGTSLNEEAANAGFDGWEIYRPWKREELDKSIAIKSADRAAMNQANQMIANEQHRIRMGEHPFIEGVNEGRGKAVNTATQFVSTPDHILWGGLKAMFDPNYTAQDYKRAFDINPYGATEGRIHGLGSATNVEGAPGVVMDVGTSVYALPGVIGGIRNLWRKATPNKVLVRGEPRTYQRVVTTPPDRPRNTTRRVKGHTAWGSPVHTGHTPRTGHGNKIVTETLPGLVRSETVPKTMIANPKAGYYPITREIEIREPIVEELPTSRFYYPEEEVSNKYKAMGNRIYLGDFQPGDTSPRGYVAPTSNVGTTYTPGSGILTRGILAPGYTPRTDVSPRRWVPQLDASNAY